MTMTMTLTHDNDSEISHWPGEWKCEAREHGHEPVVPESNQVY